MDSLPIEVRNLEKSYRRKLGLSSFKAVDSLSFELHTGEILGFLGPNGAGKTTTIKCILGLLRPSKGYVRLWGDVPGSGKVRRRIGYVPENPDYEDIFTPLELLDMFASMRRLETGRKEHLELLERVNLSGWESVRLRNFSKGMRQRVSLALALQSRPDLLVMDEPTGGLDPVAMKEFRDVILEENRRGASIFLSSHLLSEVEAVCHRAIILSKGRKVAEGTMEDLLRTEDRFVITYRPPGGDASSEPLEKEVPEAVLQETIDELRREGCFIERVNPLYRSLEEVFLSATESAGGGK